MGETLETINSAVNSLVWGPPFLILLMGTGAYLTYRIGFFQFRHLGLAWKYSFGRLFRKTKEAETGSISSFGAVASAMAATIGVGNIAGVSTAIALGGPGAVFWMWLSALVGMATKFGEASLGVKYRKVEADGSISGGVFHYIENGLGQKWKWLAVLYAFLAGIAALGIGNMVQANTMADSLSVGFNVPPAVTGVIAMILVGLVILGGIQRIAKAAVRLVPFMATVYVIGALLVILLNITQLPAVIGDIFYYAFNPHAATGGFAGAAVAASIRYGIARGVFSNEAGLGAASIVHAQAKNTPARQGMWGIWEVFIDTIVVGSMTAFAILITGVLDTGETGQALASQAFATGLPAIGSEIVLVGIVLFSYTTMLPWSFYGEKSWEYIFGTKVVLPYRLVFIAFLLIGAVGGLEFIWSLADTLNGLMAAPNLIALIALAGVLAKEKKSFMLGLKEGREKLE